MNRIEIMNQFKNVYVSSFKEKEYSFLFATPVHLIISCEIASATWEHREINFEQICELVPKKLGSRSTIGKVLNDAVASEYFLKDGSKNDARKRYYVLGSKYESFLGKWIDSIGIGFREVA